MESTNEDELIATHIFKKMLALLRDCQGLTEVVSSSWRLQWKVSCFSEANKLHHDDE